MSEQDWPYHVRLLHDCAPQTSEQQDADLAHQLAAARQAVVLGPLIRAARADELRKVAEATALMPADPTKAAAWLRDRADRIEAE